MAEPSAHTFSQIIERRINGSGKLTVNIKTYGTSFDPRDIVIRVRRNIDDLVDWISGPPGQDRYGYRYELTQSDAQGSLVLSVQLNDGIVKHPDDSHQRVVQRLLVAFANMSLTGLQQPTPSATASLLEGLATNSAPEPEPNDES